MRSDFEKLDERGRMRLRRWEATEELIQVSRGIDLLRYLFTGFALLGVVVTRSWGEPVTGKNILTAVLTAGTLHIILRSIHNKWGARQREELDRNFPEPPPL